MALLPQDRQRQRRRRRSRGRGRLPHQAEAGRASRLRHDRRLPVGWVLRPAVRGGDGRQGRQRLVRPLGVPVKLCEGSVRRERVGIARPRRPGVERPRQRPRQRPRRPGASQRRLPAVALQGERLVGVGAGLEVVLGHLGLPQEQVVHGQHEGGPGHGGHVRHDGQQAYYLLLGLALVALGQVGGAGALGLRVPGVAHGPARPRPAPGRALRQLASAARALRLTEAAAPAVLGHQS